MKVLVVDDEAPLREQAKIFLERIYGAMDVTTVGSAVEALDMLKEQYFSAVISDYQMPEMDGLEFLSRVREKDKDIPFVIFTGKGREEVAMKALNMGADGYVQKGGDVRSQYVLLAQTVKQAVERREALLNLRRSEKEKTVILESLSEHVVHIDEDGTMIWANRAAVESVRDDDLVGKKCFDLWFDRDDICPGCPVLEAHELGERCDTILGSPDGRIWYVRGEPIKDPDGEIIGLLEVKDDITERSRIKDALEESEAKFQTLVDTAPSAVAILKNGGFRYFNHALKVITGYDEEELSDMCFYDLVNPPQRELVKERLSSLESDGEKTPKRYEVSIQTENGDERWLYLASTGMEFGGEKTALVIAIDITEQKQLEDVLRGSV